MNSSPLLDNNNGSPFLGAINSTLELGAYEYMWSQKGTSFRSIAEKFREAADSRISDFVPEERALETGLRVIGRIQETLDDRFDIRVHGELDYPRRLRDATHPVELLYFQGIWDLVETKSVAVVGARKASDDGLKRTRQLVKALLQDEFTIISGLAAGIDTAAHETALAEGGRTISVIGTPLGHVYPKQNAKLQKQIADEHLLISQIPIERYEAQTFRTNRFFFPERNKTMSALSIATIIVEASDTSGTLIQAREALKQGRKLFILNSCFENPNLTWPERFAKQGAIRVRDYDDIRRELVAETA